MKVKIGDAIELKCQVCDHDDFAGRQAQLSTAGMTLLNLDAFNQSAECFSCCRCGYLHWFVPQDADLKITRLMSDTERRDQWTPPV